MKRLIALLILFALIGEYGCADGGFIPPTHGDDLYEPTQKAVLLYDGVRETLIIEPTYQGRVDEFAWIVPLPAYPEFSVASHELFWELSELTNPPETFVIDFGLGLEGISAKGPPVGIEFHERTQVGIYDVVVMSAWDPEALITWLQWNDFRVSDDARSVIQEYIDKEWYFIVSRINATEVSAYELGSGTVQPLQMEFDSPEPVYPLRISSINKGSSEVLLYVLADRHVTAEGFDEEYAEWVKSSDIDRYSYPELSKLLDREYFLTKMRRIMWPVEMQDVYFQEYSTTPWVPAPWDAPQSNALLIGWALGVGTIAAVALIASIGIVIRMLTKR
ncbi:MAG: DUF2330 domain-containing protein [Candidatus Diapherotrites archaeon]|nr:DUF2330 domain-containing protein [Candidatus Diapherotrites archaeon]